MQRSWHEHLAAIREDFDRKRAEHDAERAEVNADQAEADASFAVDYANAAIDEAEYAVLDAALARKEADELVVGIEPAGGQEGEGGSKKWPSDT